MCGQCVLHETGMACPTNCAKQMRNGPCGGVRADGTCEVDADLRCVWLEALEGRARIGMPHGNVCLEPIDHRLWHRSSWLGLIEGTQTEPAAPASPCGSPARRTSGS